MGCKLINWHPLKLPAQGAHSIPDSPCVLSQVKWLHPSPVTPSESPGGSSVLSQLPKAALLLGALPSSHSPWEPESIKEKIAISFSGFLEGPQKRQKVFTPLPALRSVLSERAARYSGIWPFPARRNLAAAAKAEHLFCWALGSCLCACHLAGARKASLCFRSTSWDVKGGEAAPAPVEAGKKLLGWIGNAFKQWIRWFWWKFAIQRLPLEK